MFVSQFTVSFANSPFTSVDTAIIRSSHRRCSLRKTVLRNFTNFTEKHLCQISFFLRPATLLKKRLWHRCYPMNFVKFLRTSFSQNTSEGCFCIIRSSRRWCCPKQVFLEILQNSQENSCAKDSFLIKLQIYRVNNFIKRFRHICLLLNSSKFIITLF